MLAWRRDGRMEEEEEGGEFIDKTEMSFWLLLLRCACVGGAGCGVHGAACQACALMPCVIFRRALNARDARVIRIHTPPPPA